MRCQRALWFLISILSCLCVAFGPPVLTDSDLSRRTLTLHQIRSMYELPAPELSAVSALLLNTSTGQILYARNEHERRAPASLVKMMTATVALQRGRQDQAIIIRKGDLKPGSSASLHNGEKLPLRQLLFALLLPSDNAASMVIARGLAGDEETFVNWMNDLAKSWGLTDTHFANPHGLDRKDGYSTAYDMAILASYAMTDRTFSEIVRRPQAFVAGRRLESTNELLTTYPGTIGVKTGTTDRAGECLVTMVDRPSGKMLSVVMGSQDRFLDTRLLLDYAYANFAEIRIDLPNTLQNRYLTEGHNWREFTLRTPITLLVSPWQVSAVSFYRRIDDITDSPDPDVAIGALEVTLAGQHLTEAPIYAR